MRVPRCMLIRGRGRGRGMVTIRVGNSAMHEVHAPWDVA